VQPGFVGSKAPALGPVPAQRIFPLLDAVLNVAASVSNFDHLRGRQPGIGHDEPDPSEELSSVPLDLGNDSRLLAPCLCLAPHVDQPDLNAALSAVISRGE